MLLSWNDHVIKLKKNKKIKKPCQRAKIKLDLFLDVFISLSGNIYQ